MERLRALSNERDALEVGLKEAVEETQRLTARTLANSVTVEQKR